MRAVARRLPLILLPPSEGKAPGGSGAPWAPGRMTVDVDDRRVEVLEDLARAMRGNESSRQRLLGVRGAALAAATTANRSVREAPTMPAIERYTGVLYDELDHASLPAPSRRRLGTSVLILSGLWGVVAPGDPVPDYKLKMSATLGRGPRLSTRWVQPVSDALDRIVGGRAVWNLLPREHDAAWRPSRPVDQVSVEFLEPGRSGALVAVSHWNKLLKGALVRHLLAEPSTTIDDLADWEHPLGFRLDRSRTREDRGRTVVSMVRSS